MSADGDRGVGGTRPPAGRPPAGGPPGRPKARRRADPKAADGKDVRNKALAADRAAREGTGAASRDGQGGRAGQGAAGRGRTGRAGRGKGLTGARHTPGGRGQRALRRATAPKPKLLSPAGLAYRAARKGRHGAQAASRMAGGRAGQGARSAGHGATRAGQSAAGAGRGALPGGGSSSDGSSEDGRGSKAAAAAGATAGAATAGVVAVQSGVRAAQLGARTVRQTLKWTSRIIPLPIKTVGIIALLVILLIAGLAMAGSEILDEEASQRRDTLLAMCGDPSAQGTLTGSEGTGGGPVAGALAPREVAALADYGLRTAGVTAPSQHQIQVATAIAKGESSHNPDTHNDVPPDDSYGLWQINMLDELGPDRRAQFGLERDDQLFSPKINAIAMGHISRGGATWQPWTVYTRGTYEQHMAEAAGAASEVAAMSADEVTALVDEVDATVPPDIPPGGFDGDDPGNGTGELVGLSCSPSTGTAGPERQAILDRAETWLTAGPNGGPVPYSMSPPYHSDGYRRDCSGFVSMTWEMGKPGATTVTLASTHAEPISKTELLPGDILLDSDPGSIGHVVLFERWANDEQTQYWAYEQVGGCSSGGPCKTVHRLREYPYGSPGTSNPSTEYEPYRSKELA